LLHAINFDETGHTLADPDVWTGTYNTWEPGDKASLGYPPPKPGDESWYPALVGNSEKTDTWLYDTLRPQAYSLHVYGVSQVLTAVPEPGCLALWTFALVAGGGYGIVRRKNNVTPARP
jgi:hypothetical protein